MIDGLDRAEKHRKILDEQWQEWQDWLKKPFKPTVMPPSNPGIGNAGFGFFRTSDGSWHRNPHKYGVKIGKDVEIGQFTAIDRGSYRDTTIGDGTKIDNLVHIAHNVITGRNVVIIAGAIICGSVEIGDGAYIGARAVIREHCKIGEGAFVAMGAVVTKDVPPRLAVRGCPAQVYGPAIIPPPTVRNNEARS